VLVSHATLRLQSASRLCSGVDGGGRVAMFREIAQLHLSVLETIDEEADCLLE